jgi:hypothetical protein
VAVTTRSRVACASCSDPSLSMSDAIHTVGVSIDRFSQFNPRDSSGESLSNDAAWLASMRRSGRKWSTVAKPSAGSVKGDESCHASVERMGCERFPNVVGNFPAIRRRTMKEGLKSNLGERPLSARKSLADDSFMRRTIAGAFTAISTAAWLRTPAASSDRYLLYTRHSRVDLFDGAFSGVARQLVDRRIRSDGPSAPDSMRRRARSGRPPVRTALDR